jgi:hypothetical protein
MCAEYGLGIPGRRDSFEDEDSYTVEYSGVKSAENKPTFRMNISEFQG